MQKLIQIDLVLETYKVTDGIVADLPTKLTIAKIPAKLINLNSDENIAVENSMVTQKSATIRMRKHHLNENLKYIVWNGVKFNVDGSVAEYETDVQLNILEDIDE